MDGGSTGPPKVGTDRGDLEGALPGYAFGEVLGRGAFATVYAARHVRLNRDVAIKRLSPELLRDADARDRFAAEARLLASLDHPHVVRVHDYVETEDVGALVMERLRGGTLADRMALGEIAPPRACAIAIAALHGLEHAHQHGVLHRDIKPTNLLFGDGDLIKVADFGIAKVIGAQGARLTATAGTLGTPAFMAPEQVRRAAGPLSTATDVWAVGALLYELLAGRPPFDSDGDIGEVLLRRVTDDAPSLTSVAPDVPEPIAAVVMQALARDPKNRPQTAAAFAGALEAAAAQAFGPGALEETGVPLHRTEPRRGSAATLVEPAEVDLVPERPARRRRAPVLAGLAVAAAVIAAVVIIAGGGNDKPAGGAEAALLSALPAPMPGWPKAVAVGFRDDVEGAAGTARRTGSGGLTWGVFDGDAAKHADWSHNPKEDPVKFVGAAKAAGIVPFAVYYQIRALGRTGNDDANAAVLRQTLVNRKLMRAYWENAKLFLQKLGSTGTVVAIDLEPGAWAALEQQLGFSGNQLSTIRARVAGSGMPELAGLTDDFKGFIKAWITLRGKYAPKVLLGYALDDYGTNVDLSRDLVSPKVAADAGREVGEFMVSPGAIFDFAVLEIAFNEGGQYNDRQALYSSAEKDNVVAFVKRMVQVSGLPVVLDWVPEGNSVFKTITEKPYHYSDSWVQWLIGDDGFTGLRKMRDAGVVGVQLGVPVDLEGETCACDAAKDGITNGGKQGLVSTSPDDDGGYLALRMAALRKAGGIALRQH
jgi:tRNA A-37 threonylcarbamoyl transferase component Bud32